MFNEEFQVSNQNQRKKDRSNSSSLKRQAENYDDLAKQIEGISHLLKNLNNFVQKSPQVNDKKHSSIRFSYKMNKTENLAELPEQPEEEEVQYLPKKEDQKSNAYTLKTTQMSSKDEQDIINIKVDNQKGISPKKKKMNHIKIKKVKRPQRVTSPPLKLKKS